MKEQAKIESVFKKLNFDVQTPVAQILWNTNLQQLLDAPNYNLKIKDILRKGQSSRIHFPDVRRKCEFDMNVENIEKYFDTINKDKVKFLRKI